MNLFYKNKKSYSIEDPFNLHTPLGHVIFKAKIDHNDIDLSFTESSKYKIECLKTSFKPVLPSGMKTDECYAFIWRIKALENFDIKIRCLLESSLIGSPEPGEHLIAQTF